MNSWRQLIEALDTASRLARAAEAGDEQAMDELENLCRTRQYRGAVLEFEIDGLLARARENDDETVTLADVAALAPDGARVAE